MADLRGIRTLEQVDLGARRVLIRADLDIAVASEGARDGDLGLKAALESARFALERGARVILAGHSGSPGGQEDPKLSLEPVASRLAELSGLDVLLPDDCLSDAAKRVISDLREGQLCVLENLAFYPGEAHPDEAFARQIASYADVYVNEAFGSSALAYASTTLLPKLFRDRAAGQNLAREIAALEELKSTSSSNLVLLIGGPSIPEAFDLMEGLMPRAKAMFFGVTPGLTLLAAGGASIPEELVDATQLSRARTLLAQARDRGVECSFPTDWVVTRETAEVFPTAGLPRGGRLGDVGPNSLERVRTLIGRSGQVLLTGSLGLPQDEERPSSDAVVARALSDADCFTVAAADDTERLLASLDDTERAKIKHISTNGHSARQILRGKTLPGIEALKTGGTGA
jgi:phosphoglycerate kinase